jgi:hypothetical protein
MVGSTYFDYFSGKQQNEDVDTKVKDEYCLRNAAEVDKEGCKKPRSCSSCLRVAVRHDPRGYYSLDAVRCSGPAPDSILRAHATLDSILIRDAW